jgi:hypothetical protein
MTQKCATCRILRGPGGVTGDTSYVRRSPERSNGAGVALVLFDDTSAHRKWHGQRLAALFAQSWLD